MKRKSEGTSKTVSTSLIALSILFILGALFFYPLYYLFKKNTPVIKIEVETYSDQPNLSQELIEKSARLFANFVENPIDFKGGIPEYIIKNDLSNITNQKYFNFSVKAKNKLIKNGFVVEPARYNEFFSLYEQNRYDFTPNFITTDSILHNYHLVFDHLLKTLEEEKLIPALEILNKSMLSSSITYYKILQNTDWENAARRNVAFFTVGSMLLNPNTYIQNFVKKEVTSEMKLISLHENIAFSPIMNIAPTTSQNDELSPTDLKEDYTQYIPRGHYTTSDDLEQYFKTMMWYGRLSFQINKEDTLKSALLISHILTNEESQKQWDKINAPIEFFIGKSDDVEYYDLKKIISEIYGENATLWDIKSSPEKFESFTELAKEIDPPKINSIPIFDESIEPDRDEAIKSFRFFGQKFTLDASIFQRLVYREVKENKKGERRMLPKSLDITATFGSSEARTILEDMGETKYLNYEENLDKTEKHILTLEIEDWTSNLYNGWLSSLKPLLSEKDERYPEFMTNQAWVRKDLNTFLGSWTELKHDTILYVKQVYAEMGGGSAPGEKDDKGYVEPAPFVYSRLSSLLDMTLRGLEVRGLLGVDNKETIGNMQILADNLKIISIKELNNENLTDDEYEIIRSYGGQLEHFWIQVNKEQLEETKLGINQYLYQNPAPIVADVATDPNGKILEEATGYIYAIFAVVPIEGNLKIAKGGVYSYYEFDWPASDRLTDQKWREMLENHEAPDMPSWTKSFISE